LKKVNEAADKARHVFARVALLAHRRPAYLNNPAQPTFFLQTPKEVTTIWQSGPAGAPHLSHVPHSENPKPSWYGESVGHYEGEWLVVDTIGQNTRTSSTISAPRTAITARRGALSFGRWRQHA